MRVRVRARSVEELVAKWPEVMAQVEELRRGYAFDPRMTSVDRAVHNGVGGVGLRMESPVPSQQPTDVERQRAAVEQPADVAPNYRKLDKDELVEMAQVDDETLPHAPKPETDMYNLMRQGPDEVARARAGVEQRQEWISAEHSPTRSPDPEIQRRFYVRRD